jgi:guanine deaminase
MDFAQRTVDIARQNVAEGGRPFATVIVRDGQILAESPNRVAQTHEVIFLTTRDAYEPHYVDDRKYFELNNFYDEFAKPWDRRRLPMRYEPRDAAVAVYEFWREGNGGDRRVQGAPRAESI